jgi:uncharacterized protein YjdB
MACADSGTTVAVLDDAAASLTISIEGDATGSLPEQLILDVGDSVSLAATGTSVLGLAVQIGTVTWASSDAAVALVDSEGLLRAVGPGSVGILASADGVSASLTALVNDTATAFP